MGKNKLNLIIGLLLLFFLGCSDPCQEAKDIAYKEGYENGVNSGKNAGHSEGLEEGKQQGAKDGYSKGFDEGYEKGKNEGLAEGKDPNVFHAKYVSGFIEFIIHIFMIISIIVMVLFLFLEVTVDNSSVEVIIRSACVILAFFLFFLAMTMGIKISEFISNSLVNAQDNMQSIFGKLGMTALFGTISAAIAHAVMKYSVSIIERVIIVFSTLLLLLFTSLYVKGWNNPDTMLVNASFVSGIIIYLMFFVKDPSGTAKNKLTDLLSYFN